MQKLAWQDARTELGCVRQLTMAAFGNQPPVAFGARYQLQLEDSVENLQWENFRLMWRTWQEGGQVSYANGSNGEQLPHDLVPALLMKQISNHYFINESSGVRYQSKSLIGQTSDRETTSYSFLDPKGPKYLFKPLPTTFFVSLYALGPPESLWLILVSKQQVLPSDSRKFFLSVLRVSQCNQNISPYFHVNQNIFLRLFTVVCKKKENIKSMILLWSLHKNPVCLIFLSPENAL